MKGVNCMVNGTCGAGKGRGSRGQCFLSGGELLRTTYRHAHNAYCHCLMELKGPKGPRIPHSSSAAMGRDGTAKPSGASGRGRTRPARRADQCRALPAEYRYRPLGASPGAPLREAAGPFARMSGLDGAAHVEQEVVLEEVEVVEEAEVVKPGNKRKVCSAAAAAPLASSACAQDPGRLPAPGPACACLCLSGLPGPCAAAGTGLPGPLVRRALQHSEKTRERASLGAWLQAAQGSSGGSNCRSRR